MRLIVQWVIGIAIEKTMENLKMAKKAKKPTRGGRREGSGRKVKHPNAKTVVVYLPGSSVDWLDSQKPTKRSKIINDLIVAAANACKAHAGAAS